MLISCIVIVQIRPAPRSGGNAAHLRKHQPIEPMFVYDGTKDLVVFFLRARKPRRASSVISVRSR
jgi:hypothetical protein